MAVSPEAQDPPHTIASINARLDRLPTWGLKRSVPIFFGLSWFVIGYDITAFAATLDRLTAYFHRSTSDVSVAVTINLVAYMVGAYVLGNVADRWGRRRAMAISLAILTGGALLTGAAWNLVSFEAFRCITGLGMGAQIALASTYITELSTPRLRGRMLSGTTIGEGLGLAAPLLIALGLLKIGAAGWRVEFWLAALAGLLLIPFLSDRWVPESPRWLVIHGDAARADRIVTDMETRLRGRGMTLPEVSEVPGEGVTEPFPTWALFRRRDLFVKVVVVFVFWFIWYVWIYAFLVYEPTIVAALGLSLPSVDWYSGVSFLAFPLGALLALRYGDRIPRVWGIVGACVLAIAGACVLAAAQSLAMVIIGAALLGVGNLGGVGLAYAYTSELFPTRARGTAMSIGDGVGHLGGALQVYMVLPVLHHLGARWAFGFIAVAVAVNLLIILVTRRRTVGRSLTELAR